MSHIVVLVTVGSTSEAASIGHTVVAEKLAACVNVVPSLASTYWWQGNVEQASEVLLIFKTRQDLLAPLTARVRALHSYNIPEVIALPIVGGNPAYLTWIDDSVRR